MRGQRNRMRLLCSCSDQHCGVRAVSRLSVNAVTLPYFAVVYSLHYMSYSQHVAAWGGGGAGPGVGGGGHAHPPPAPHCTR